jgi:hypothetical protein
MKSRSRCLGSDLSRFILNTVVEILRDYPVPPSVLHQQFGRSSCRSLRIVSTPLRRVLCAQKTLGTYVWPQRLAQWCCAHHQRLDSTCRTSAEGRTPRGNPFASRAFSIPAQFIEQSLAKRYRLPVGYVGEGMKCIPVLRSLSLLSNGSSTWYVR